MNNVIILYNNIFLMNKIVQTLYFFVGDCEIENNPLFKEKDPN